MFVARRLAVLIFAALVASPAQAQHTILGSVSGSGSGNGASTVGIGRTNLATSLISQATGGVDETLNVAFEAFRFTTPAGVTEIGGFTVRLKRDAGVTAGTVRAYLYSDSSGPSANISDATTGLPSVLSVVAGLGTSYADISLRLPKTGLTPAANYWVALNTQGVAGGSIFLDRRSSGTGLYANDADGAGAWTIENTKEPIYTILGNSGTALHGWSRNHSGVHGESTEGFGGRFISLTGPGLKADSFHMFGVGGFSNDGPGVRGTSVNTFGVEGVSNNSSGGSFQALASGQPGLLAVSTSGASAWLVPTTGPFAQAIPLDSSAGGSGWTDGYTGESITLSGGTTTDSVGNLLPAGGYIYAVVWRVTTTIGGGTATSMQIGTAAAATNFQSTTTSITAGSTGYGMNFALAGGLPWAFEAATKVRITLNGTSTAGAVRLVVFYRVFTPPGS